MATWNDFLSQLRRELEEPVEAVWADTALLWWTNEAAKELAVRTRGNRDWQFATVVAGTSSYLLPDDALQVIDVYCGNSGETLTKLIRQDLNDYAFITPDGQTGFPVTYALDDEYIYLRPAPDAAYELSFFCYSMPTELTAGTDEMPFASRYNSCIGYFVKSKAFEQINDWQAAGVMRQMFEAEVQRAIQQEGIEAQARRSVVPLEVY